MTKQSKFKRDQTDWEKDEIFDLSSQKGRNKSRRRRGRSPFPRFDTDVALSDLDSDGFTRSVTFLDRDRNSSLSPVNTTQEKTGILRQHKRTQKDLEKEKGRERGDTRWNYRTRSQHRRT